VRTNTLAHIYICMCACVCVGAEERVPSISLNHIRGMRVQAICNRFQHEARCHLLATLDTDLSQARIPALVPQLVQMVTMWMSDVYCTICYHVPCIHKSHNKVLIISASATSTLWISCCVTAWGGVFMFLFCFTLHCIMCDFRLLPHSRCELCSSALLRSQ
jgi:hypothetical protein